MNQVDWVGGPAKSERARIEIPNQRAKTAEQKARLCLEIRKACGVIPAAVVGGGVFKVRDWKAQVDASMKTAGLQRATVPELRGALDRVLFFMSPAEVAKALG